MLEHIARAQLEAGLTGAAGQQDREDTVAADAEEVVGHADLGKIQDVRKEVTEELLLRGVGRLVVAFGQSVGRRQGPAIEFAIGGQRQGVEDHPGAGHHVVGQAARQGIAQPGRVRHRARGGHEIGGQILAAGPIVAGDHRRLGDLGLSRNDASISPGSIRKPRIFT